MPPRPAALEDSKETSPSTTLATYPSPGPLSSGCLGRLVELAAQTLGTEGSFLLLDVDGTLTLAHPSGICSGIEPSQELAAQWATTPIAGELASVLLTPRPDRGLLATVALRSEGLLLGILGVCDRLPGSFSTAQEWTLQSIAAQIAQKLDQESISPGQAGREGELDMFARLRLLESVVVNANDSVLITDAEPFDLPGPIIRYVNPAFTRTTGYTSEEVVGKSPRILQGPLSGRVGPDRIRAALEQWKPVEVELLNYRKDGTTFWVELSISPVCDEKGWYTHWISVQRDVTERKANEETLALMRMTNLQNEALVEEIRGRKLIEAKLTYVAFHDGLTGVRNRGYFMDALQTALDRARSRKGYRAAVLYVDLDGFKAVNDEWGHRVGDLLLVEIARRLKHCARAQDTVARLGGDEFTLLIDDLHSVEDALETGARLRAAIQEPVLLAGMTLQVTASIGICQLNDSYTDPDSLLRDADLAMYRAKRQGNLSCVLFHESMHEEAVADLQMKLQLRAALDHREFVLFYQPLVRLDDQSILGVEALIRWNHPTRGLLAPGEFIAHAEKMGFIVELGRWVLLQACSDFRLMQEASRTSLSLNVNVSSLQLDEPDFLPCVLEAMEHGGIPPHLLQLEITESVFLKDAATVGALFREIRACGVKIAFDDFGTGYSSLGYVEKYPIDILKIDQSFVQHMARSAMNANIVQMIIRIAHSAGMTVSAEGVETLDQANSLAEYGCSLAQGYLYSRPLPLTELIRLLVRGYATPA